MERKSHSKSDLYSTLENEVAEQDALLPPWLKHPEIQRYSMGWRMGYGEHYLENWHRWAKLLDQDQLIRYFEKHAPIPIPWLDWTASELGYDQENIDLAVSRLVELGIAESFDAFKAWQMQRGKA